MSASFEKLAAALDGAALEAVAAALLTELDGVGGYRWGPDAAAVQKRSAAPWGGEDANGYGEWDATAEFSRFVRKNTPYENIPPRKWQGKPRGDSRDHGLGHAYAGESGGQAPKPVWPAAYPAGAASAPVRIEAERLSERFEIDARRYDRGFERY